jgi:hypothetical protein
MSVSDLGRTFHWINAQNRRVPVLGLPHGSLYLSPHRATLLWLFEIAVQLSLPTLVLGFDSLIYLVFQFNFKRQVTEDFRTWAWWLADALWPSNTGQVAEPFRVPRILIWTTEHCVVMTIDGLKPTQAIDWYLAQSKIYLYLLFFCWFFEVGYG